MSVDHLNREELMQVYRALSLANYGDDPTLRDRDAEWYTHRVQNQLNVFNPQTFADADVGVEGAVIPDTPQARFIDLARRAVSGQTIADSTDILYLHTLLALNGHNADEGFAFDGEINQVELDALRIVVEGYDAGNTTAENLDAAQAAQAEVAAAQAAAEAAAFDASQLSLTEQFGFRAAGFNGTREEMIQEFTHLHQGSLQRFSAEIFGEPMNLNQIRERMLDIEDNPDIAREFTTQALAHVIQSTDYAQEIVAGLESGDAQLVQEAQAVLRLSEMDITADGFAFDVDSPNITGNVDVTSVESAQEYILSDDRTALGDAHIAYTGVIAHSVIRHDILEGTIPIDLTGLPDYFRADMAEMSEIEFANDLASYLSNPANFAAYNLHLVGSGVDTELYARAAAIPVAAETVVEPDVAPEPVLEENIIPDPVNNAASLVAAGDIGVAAANLGLDVPDHVVLDDNIAQFNDPEFSLTILSASIYDWVDAHSSMGVGTFTDGVDVNNVTFAKMMEYQNGPTAWYDQVYGGEFSPGSRVMIDTVVAEGIPYQEAAERVGLDPTAPLNLEDPQVLAQVTEAVFLVTRGQTFSADVAPPFTQDTLLSASQNALVGLGVLDEEDIVPPAQLNRDEGVPVASADFTNAALARVRAGGTGLQLAQQGAVFAPEVT